MLFYYPYCIFQLLSLRSCFFLIAANHDKHHMHPDRLLRSFKTPSPFLCRTKTPMGQYSTPNQKKICQPPLHWEHHWVDDTSASVIAPLLVIGMTADSCVELDKPYLLSHPAETLRFAHIGPIKYQVLSYINMVPSFDFIAYKCSEHFCRRLWIISLRLELNGPTFGLFEPVISNGLTVDATVHHFQDYQDCSTSPSPRP